MNRPFRHPFRVAFADTDASGRAHFTSLLRRVEEAEHALLAELGVPVWIGDGSGWPRVRIECDYRQPLHFQDEAAIELEAEKLGKASVTWAFRVRREGEAVAEGRMVAVFVTANGTPGELPSALREFLGG